MEMTILIIGIILCLAGILAIGFGPKRATTTTVVNVVKHEYKTSKDYGRLYDLLIEGRDVIIINNNGYPSKAFAVDLEQPPLGNAIKRFYGFNLDFCLDGCTKDKFILYCQFHDITYLDQIDKYLLMEDYMKK